MRKIFLISGVVCLAAGLVATGVHATMVIPMNFDQLLANADRVFIGTCTAVNEGTTKEGIPYAEYTFTVSEALRGSVGETVTIRQFGQLTPKRVDDKLLQNFRVQGMPTYKPGQRMLLLLRSDSQLGLTSPIGLFQGAFSVQLDAEGAEVAVNGSNNVNLFQGMKGLPKAAADHRLGPVPLSLLVDLVRTPGRRGRGRR